VLQYEISTENLDQNILFVPALGLSYEVNDTAKEILRLLMQERSVEEIAKDLARRYDLDWRDVYVDVIDFVQKLKVYGLIK
jgi:DNA-binding transcriptional ArsR family regulator